MRYLVLSDVHANIEALDAVLDAARPVGYDRVLLLGDLVGYGAAPNEVVTRIAALDVAGAVRGNHDKVSVGLESTAHFNPLARHAADWTRASLSPETAAYLAGLPQGPVAIDGLIEICHGTPFDEDAYVFDGLDAMRALNAASRPLCLFGHTHIPLVIGVRDAVLSHDDVRAPYRLVLDSASRYVINAGAVGQPRDGNPEAASAIVDTEGPSVEFLRVPYDVEAAQARIRAAGLPAPLAQRLTSGR
jgi:diadenosine tetraphosphatase ApaH/serine/threonine PP2A family protein phosphatase